MLRSFTGQRASVWIDNNHGNIITTGNTVAGTRYFVMDRGPASNLPVPPGVIFMSPRGGTQIALTAGDRVQIISEERFCKTSVSFELSTDSVDASTDCFPGASIPSNVTNFSGSMSGLFQYDQATEDFVNVTASILNKFMPHLDLTGAGSYTYTAKDDNHAYLLVQMNEGATAGQTENWLYAPIIITSTSVSLGNTDAQGLELSFTLGYGIPITFTVPAA